MNNVWLKIFAVLLGASIFKYTFMHWVAWIVIDLAALGVCYIILRRVPYIDLRKSMLFIGGLTLLNILVDIGLISGLVGNIIMLGVIVWMIFGRPGGGPRRPVMRYKWHK